MNSIDFITEVHNNALEVVRALEKLRDNTSDDEWDSICDNEHLDHLLSTVMDLEYTFDQENKNE